MSKKKRQITDLQFKAGILIIIVLIMALFYFAFMQERFAVRENSIGQEPLIKNHLDYETEFCANRLTRLVNEIHFLQKETKTEENILGEEVILQEQETKGITTEQRELQEVNVEFETYKAMCDQFDENPTAELCTAFLQEAKDYYEVAQKNAEDTIGLQHVEILIKDLREAKRIYAELQDVCASVE